MVHTAIDLEKEIWKPVVGFPKYEVSNMGRLRSLPLPVLRKFNDGRMLIYTAPGRIIEGRKEGGHIRLNIQKDKVRHQMLLHRLILEAFVGPCPEGLICCHNDGDYTNNRVENLRWDTRKSNMSDAKKHGTFVPPPIKRGAEVRNAKLNPEQVRAIRSRPYYRGLFINLAKEFNIHKVTARDIYRNVIWRHIS